MTNELEKTFFYTFGIGPKDRFKGCTLGVNYYSETCKKETCRGCDCEIKETVYPQITDHILLELICIAHTSPVITFVSRDVKSLKEEVLMVLCNWVNCRDIKNQVQALFKKE